jgi:hypothetical protein
LDVVAKSFTRMAQEILLKQEKISVNLTMGALAGATTNNLQHVQRANTAGEFVLADLNELLTLGDRIHTSWNGGTPEEESTAVTDMLVSPEIMEKIRAMAYNPINTKGAVGTTPDATNAGHLASDAVRDQVFTAGGVGEFYGINFIKLRELGAGKKFNTIFDTLADTTPYTNAAGGASAGFDGPNEEILVGINRNKTSLIRAVATDSDAGGDFTVTPDDQYSNRQRKIGWFGDLEEGRVILDQRALVGKIV